MSEAPDRRADLEAGDRSDGRGEENLAGNDDRDAAREVMTSQPGAHATPKAEEDKALLSGAEIPTTPPRSFSLITAGRLCRFCRTF